MKLLIVENIINPFRTLIKVVSEVLQGNWGKAFDELSKGIKRQFNNIEDYQKGYADEVQAQAERATKKQKLELEKQLLHEKEYNEAKYGSDWKYTKDGIELYRKYFAAKLALYDKDSEEYRQALLEQISFERELKEHQEGKSGKSRSGSTGKSKVEIQREIEDATIAAMEDGFAKQWKLLRTQQRRELLDAENNAKLQNALLAKHQKEQQDLINELYEELLNNPDTKDAFVEAIAKALDVKKEDILDYELMIYNTDKPCFVGLEDDFVSSPRLDNLTSTQALIEGITSEQRTRGINMMIVFDHEEVGSRSKQGRQQI